MCLFRAHRPRSKSPPPQVAHTLCRTVSTQWDTIRTFNSCKYVHQGTSGGRSQSHHSQLGLSSSIIKILILRAKGPECSCPKRAPPNERTTKTRATTERNNPAKPCDHSTRGKCTHRRHKRDHRIIHHLEPRICPRQVRLVPTMVVAPIKLKFHPEPKQNESPVKLPRRETTRACHRRKGQQHQAHRYNWRRSEPFN